MKRFSFFVQWIQKNRVEFLVILLIILVAFLMRVWRIDQYMTFLGDEGRDMLIMKKIWVEGDLPFIGPPTSVGNMYLGPLYYYLMAIPTGIFWMNPVSAAVMVALFGTATVGFIYYLARIWFGRISAVAASLLYAFSPVNIIYSQSSWNPNPAPFFALLSLFGIFKVHRTGNMYWIILTAVGLAFAIQMHYLALLLLPAMGLLWIYEVVLHYREKLKRITIWRGTLYAASVFIGLMSPLVFFDIKHNYPNFRAFMTLLSGKDSALGNTPNNPIVRASEIFSNLLVGRYFGLESGWLLVIVSLLVLIPFIWVGVAKLRGSRLNWPYLGLGVWLFVGIVGLTQYKNSIYDHYLGFLNPAPFILFGALGGLLFSIKNKGIRYGLLSAYCLLIIIVLFMMVQSSPLLKNPNRQLQRTQVIAKEVLASTGGKQYNFALIAKSNYDAAYQFFLEQYGQKPGLLPFEKTEQLFVVCEDAICEPINNPKHEIAAFGMAKIEWEKDFEGIKLFKLVANPTGN